MLQRAFFNQLFSQLTFTMIHINRDGLYILCVDKVGCIFIFYFYFFQDKNNLYFVMEYVPGGDLMSKLIRDNIFSEDLAR